MPESKDFLETFFQKVINKYSNTSWSRFNRTGLGIIGLILLPFLWNYAINSKEFSLSIFVGLLCFSATIIINALPLIAFAYLFVKQNINENQLERDENFVSSIKQKVERGENVTDHEARIYKTDILKRKAKGQKLVGIEFCADIMSSEESFEHFLFRTTDDDFIFGLYQLKESLSSDEFSRIISIIGSKVPRRMDQLFNKKIDDLHQRLQK